MIQIIEYAIDLTFGTDMGESLTITAPNANPAVTGAEVSGAMNRIINARAVWSTAGEPVSIRKAELVATETLDYDLS